MQLSIERAVIQDQSYRQKIDIILDVLAKSVLFILCKRAHRLFIQIEHRETWCFRVHRLLYHRFPDGTKERLRIRMLPPAAADFRYQTIQHVQRLIEQINGVGSQRHFTESHAVKHRFQFVSKTGNMIQTQHAGNTFQRMELPKNLVDQFGPNVVLA